MALPRRIFALFGFVVTGAFLACVGGGGGVGGGSSGTSGTTSGDPTSSCQDYVTLTADCYRKGGKDDLQLNPAVCGATLDARTLATIECSLQYRDAYCATISASVSRDSGALIAAGLNADVIKLNACVAARATASPCKEAVAAMAECGAGFGADPACGEPSAGMAKCVLANTKGACAFYKPQGGTLPPEAQEYMKCQNDAIRADRDANP